MARLQNILEERDEFPPTLVPRILQGFVLQQDPFRNAIKLRAGDLLPLKHTPASKQEEIESSRTRQR